MAGMAITQCQVFPISNFGILIGMDLWRILCPLLHEVGLLKIPYEFHDIGMQIHLASMIIFGSVIFVRFYHSHRAGYKMIEKLDSILK